MAPFLCSLPELRKVGFIGFKQVFQYTLHLIGRGTERMSEQRLECGVAVTVYRGIDREQFIGFDMSDQGAAGWG